MLGNKSTQATWVVECDFSNFGELSVSLVGVGDTLPKFVSPGWWGQSPYVDESGLMVSFDVYVFLYRGWRNGYFHQYSTQHSHEM